MQADKSTRRLLAAIAVGLFLLAAVQFAHLFAPHGARAGAPADRVHRVQICGPSSSSDCAKISYGGRLLVSAAH